MKRILAAVITAAVIIGSFPMGIITRAAAPEEKLISMKFDLGGGTLAGRTGVIEIEFPRWTLIVILMAIGVFCCIKLKKISGKKD